MTSLPTAVISPLTEAGQSTWEAIAELSELIPINRWVVVGGQMVAIHASIFRLQPPRVTDDGDVVVDVRGFGRQAMRDVAGALTSIGFITTASPEGVTRFERTRAKIDLLAPEGIGSNVVTVPPGYAIQAPGSSQAISRARPVVVDWGAARVTVHCPSLLGAIVAKAAACREIVSITADERLKHQSDFVFLLSVATTLDIDALEGMAAEMTPRDRKRIKAALDPMAADGTHRSRFAAHNFDDVQDVATLLLG